MANYLCNLLISALLKAEAERERRQGQVCGVHGTPEGECNMATLYLFDPRVVLRRSADSCCTEPRGGSHACERVMHALLKKTQGGAKKTLQGYLAH